MQNYCGSIILLSKRFTSMEYHACWFKVAIGTHSFLYKAETMAEIFTAMWTLSTYLRLIQAGLVYIFFLYAGWFTFYVCDKVAYGLRYDHMYNIYTHSFLYICLFVLVLFLVMIVLIFYLVVLILCKSLTRDEGCKLALCYMPYVHGIGCLCVTMPSVLSLLNKQTNKKNNSQRSTLRSDLIIIQSVWNDMKKQNKLRQTKSRRIQCSVWSTGGCQTKISLDYYNYYTSVLIILVTTVYIHFE